MAIDESAEYYAREAKLKEQQQEVTRRSVNHARGILGVGQESTLNQTPNGAQAMRERTVAEHLEQKIWEHKGKAQALERLREKLSIEFLSMPSSFLDALK